MRTLARIPGRVLSLAIGDAGDGPAIAVETPEAVLLLSSAGGLLAHRDFDLSLLRPVRDPAAALALGDFGGGRLAVQLAGAPRAEVLARHGDRLEVVATLEAAPLCASEGSRLFGAFAPGKGLFLDQLETTIDPAARPRSPASCTASRLRRTAAGSPSQPSIPTSRSSCSARTSSKPPLIAGVGVGFALADLHGDGDAELIASLPAGTARTGPESSPRAPSGRWSSSPLRSKGPSRPPRAVT